MKGIQGNKTIANLKYKDFVDSCWKLNLSDHQQKVQELGRKKWLPKTLHVEWHIWFFFLFLPRNYHSRVSQITTYGCPCQCVPQDLFSTKLLWRLVALWKLTQLSIAVLIPPFWQSVNNTKDCKTDQLHCIIKCPWHLPIWSCQHSHRCLLIWCDPIFLIL